MCHYKLLLRSFRSPLKRQQLRRLGSELLAECVASLIPQAVKASDIKRQPHGQPYWENSSKNGVFLSLSHSGDYLVAMASTQPCGVDIERHKMRPFAELWQQIKHADEPHCPADLAEFYQWWTRKEAAWKVYACQRPRTMKDLPVVGEQVYDKLLIKDLAAPEGYALSIAMKTISL